MVSSIIIFYKNISNYFLTKRLKFLILFSFLISSLLFNSGDEMFQCIWLKYRGPNIYEFMIGKTNSRNATIRLCDDSQFEDQTWTTQARQHAKQTTGCPIVGDYSGIVPGESSLCAKIASDCNNPDIMFYTVALCANKSHIFERTYSYLSYQHRSASNF